jgi:hypothetical protein
VAEFGGRNPWGYHLASVVFHGLNGCLVFLLIRELLRRSRPAPPEAGGAGFSELCAGAGALLWVAHPLRVEAVAWASALLHCQATFFLLSATWLYLKAYAPEATPRKQRLCYFASVLALAASLASYPIGLGFVVILLVVDVWVLGRLRVDLRAWREAKDRKVWLEKIPFLAVTGAVLGITAWTRLTAGGGWLPSPSLADFGLGHRFMQACYVWAYYLWKPWVPFDLSPVYTTLLSFRPTDAALGWSLMFLLIISAVLWTQRRRWPGLLALWLAYLTLLVPVLGLTEHPHYPSDRYSYLVGILWSIAMASGLSRLTRQPRRFAAAWGCCIALGLVFGTASERQTRIWRNSETLFRYTLQQLGRHPYRADIHWRLGMALADEGKLDEAIANYRAALSVVPSFGEVHYHLALALERQKKGDEALEHYLTALRLLPDYLEAHRRAAALLSASGKAEEARAHLRRASELASSPLAASRASPLFHAMAGGIGVAPVLLSWVGLFGLARELAARKIIPSDWRLCWVVASLAWGAFVVLVVELASLARALTAPTLFMSWSCILLAVSGIAAKLAVGRGLGFSRMLEEVRRWRARQAALGLAADVILMWSATILVAGFLGLVALAIPTTTGDSLTYHLPRVMHWIQQQSVAHYPTGNCRQNELGPWSEFVTVTLHLLWGSDRLVNLVQWFAMLSSVFVAPYIALQLFRQGLRGVANVTGPDMSTVTEHRLVALTSLLIVTLPIGMVEAMTTQTDHTTTFWLVCLVSLSLAWLRQPRNYWLAAAAGSALGLGTLTKATMLIYAGPPMLVVACWLWSRTDRLRMVALFLVVFLGLNLGHMTRNQALVGSPLSGAYIRNLVLNRAVSPGGTWSNLVRNLALETTTPFPSVNTPVNKVLAWLQRWSGKDLNDADTTYELCLFQWPEELLIYDSQASNPYHLLLIVTAAVLALGKWKWNRVSLGYAVAFAASFVLFCALLRWQEWHSRMHLPYLALLMPFVAAVLTRHLPGTVVLILGILAAGIAGHCGLRNQSRPLFDPTFTRLPREAQYLAIHTPHFYAAYFKACEDVLASGCRNIGLKLQYGEMEYAFWVMLHNRGFRGRLDHVYVEDPSGRIPSSAPPPCLVLTTFDPPPPALTNDFPVCQKYGHVTLCRRQGQAASP